MQRSLYRLPLAILLGWMIAFSSCNGNNEGKAAGAPAKADTVLDAMQDLPHAFGDLPFDSASLASFFAQYPKFTPLQQEVRNFYANRGYTYAWYDKQGITEPAHSLLQNLGHVDSGFMHFRMPYGDTVNSMFQDHEAAELPSINKDLMLTAQYLNYAIQRWGQQSGVDPGKIGWFIPRKKMDYESLLNKALGGQSYDRIANETMNRFYLGLKKELLRYRQLEKSAVDWSEIGFTGDIRPGDRSVNLPLIRSRLQLLGFIKASDTTTIYAEPLISSVNLYKKSMGHKQDGNISRDVVVNLNVPLRKRIETMLVNVERMRWLPKMPVTGEAILVNIPEYRLHYFSDSLEVWGCSVVTGKPLTKTVIFSGNIKHIVFSPYWYVPPSIISKEVVPGMRRNPNYLASHRMEWNGGNVRQLPGPANSLGLVKFIFPNSNNIYLHDTPSKSLFSEDNRAFSHGCVRVGEPRELAIRILKDDPQWTPESVDAAMHSGKERFVPIKKPLSVYIAYFTAFVDKDGLLNFRPDVYGRDEKLSALLTASR